MHVVIFEVRPKAGRKGDYLDIAAALRPELEQIDGFISIERFASLTDEGKVLSLSFWRDEAAVVRWRQHAEHQAAQARGRHEIFRSEEHTSELQSLMRISYAVFCLKKKKI